MLHTSIRHGKCFVVLLLAVVLPYHLSRAQSIKCIKTVPEQTTLDDHDFKWTDSYTFLLGIEDYMKDVTRWLKADNKMPRKRRSELNKKLGLTADFFGNHVRKDGDTLRCFFTNEEELKECGLLGHGQVVFENNNWLVYEVKDISGLNQTDAYVFSIAQDGLLELNGSVRIIAGRIKSSYGINMDPEGLFTICFQGDKPNNPVFVHRCVPAEEKQSLSRQGLTAM